jgi:ATP-dependent DNA helicase PIF1
MSRATLRTNIKILALSPDADAQEEAKKMEKKMLKRMLLEKRMHQIKKIRIRRPQ